MKAKVARLPLRIIDRFKFIVERQLVKGAGFQLLVVGLLIGLISLIGGLLVMPQGGDFDRLGAAIWWAFLRLTDPGYLGDDIGSWQRVVSTFLTVSGYVVFMGTLVAILTRWLIAKMEELERGLTPVTMRNHIVILGWSAQTPPLVAELFSSSGRVKRFLEKHDTQKLRLAVLAEEAGAEKLHQLKSEPGLGARANQVVLRSGYAIQSEALQRVACLDAAAVIIPSRGHDARSLVTSDVDTVKALLSIAVQARHLGRAVPFVVAEIQDMRKISVIERAYPGSVEVVAGDVSISRLIAQNVLHPGLSEIYNELLTAGEGNEIFVRSGDTAEGMSIGEIAAQRPCAIVLGLLHPAPNRNGWEVDLLAPSDTLIRREDRIVLLAKDYAHTGPSPKVKPLSRIERSAPASAAVVKTGLHRVLVLGWNRRVPSLVAELASYSGRKFKVDMVSIIPIEERRREIAHYGVELEAVKGRLLEGDYMVADELRKLKPATYHTVILLSSDRIGTGEEADARAMFGYLQLEDILPSSGNRPQVIMELSDPHNRSLMYGHQSEILISPIILSHILAQVALRPELRVVLDDLFTVGGPEIQFRDPGDYPLPANADFHAMEKVVATRGEIALGVYRAAVDGKGRHLLMNPARAQLLNLRDNDRLVVLSCQGSR